MVFNQQIKDGSTTDADDAMNQIQAICDAFKPIVNCAGKEAAAQCQFKVGKGQIFRLSSMLILCEVTVQMKPCQEIASAVAADDAAVTTTMASPNGTLPAVLRCAPAQFADYGGQPLPVTAPPGFDPTSMATCAMQFPDIENQTKDYRNNIEPPPTDLSGTVTPEIQPIFEFGSCSRLLLYAGCWLHSARSVCGITRATTIVHDLYQIYNDLSGQRCSTADQADSMDYNQLEINYVSTCLSDDGPTTVSAMSSTDTRKRTSRFTQRIKVKDLTTPGTAVETFQAPDGMEYLDDEKDQQKDAGNAIISNNALVPLSLALAIFHNLFSPQIALAKTIFAPR